MVAGLGSVVPVVPVWVWICIRAGYNTSRGLLTAEMTYYPNANTQRTTTPPDGVEKHMTTTLSNITHTRVL